VRFDVCIKLLRVVMFATQVLQATTTASARIIDCVYITGLNVEADDYVVRLTGWSHMPDPGGEMAERGIVIRVALSATAARDLRRKLNDRLRETQQAHAAA
jgi:hypothetical protein